MRNTPKLIYQFMKKEVGITKAEWGEVRKVDRKKVVQDGLPNIPKLTLTKDPFVYYLAVIRKIKELRIYAFSKEGMMLPAKSFYNDEIDSSWLSVKRQSKKLARYPSTPKTLSQSQKNRELNKVFKRVWENTLTTFNVPKEFHKQYPTLIETKDEKIGPWETSWNNKEVYIPQKIKNLKTICYYYSFLFILPEQIRKYKDLSSIVTSKFMLSFRQLKGSHKELMEHSPAETESIINKLSGLNVKELYNFLLSTLSLYPYEWDHDDIALLIKNLQEIIQITQSSMILYELFRITGTTDFYGLACLHAIIDESQEKIPPICLTDNKYFALSSAISSFQYSKVVFIKNNNKFSLVFEKTITKALEKSFNKVISAIEDGLYNNSDQKLIISKIDNKELEKQITIEPLSILYISVDFQNITIHFPELYINFPVNVNFIN